MRNAPIRKSIQAIALEVHKRCGDKEGCQLIEGDRITREYVEQGKLPRVDWTTIIEHIEHAVKIAGLDHVGLGSPISTAPTCLTAWRTPARCQRSPRPCYEKATRKVT